jgi:hypothetical protein
MGTPIAAASPAEHYLSRWLKYVSRKSIRRRVGHRPDFGPIVEDEYSLV